MRNDTAKLQERRGANREYDTRAQTEGGSVGWTGQVSLSPLVPSWTYPFHSRRQPFIFSRSPLMRSVLRIQRRRASSDSTKKKDERRVRTDSKEAEGEVNSSAWEESVSTYRRKRRGRERRTSKVPDDGESGDDEEVDAFEEETIPESELSREGHRVGEEGDVPLGGVGRGRDEVLGLSKEGCEGKAERKKNRIDVRRRHGRWA